MRLDIFSDWCLVKPLVVGAEFVGEGMTVDLNIMSLGVVITVEHISMRPCCLREILSLLSIMSRRRVAV